MRLPSSSTKHSSETTSLSAGSSVNILTVGDWQQREFVLASAKIHDAEKWQTVPDIQSVIGCIEKYDSPPELILLAQSVPGEYLQSDIDALCEFTPLSRIIVVAGTWCEGEIRTGTWLHGTLRLYWYELASWWQAAFQNLADGSCPPWSLPLDNPQAGRCRTVPHNGPPLLSGMVAIDAADFYVFESLSAALACREINTVWTPHPDSKNLASEVAAGIWDGGQLSDQELTRLTSFCKKVGAPHNKVIALLDFPRLEHIEQTRAAGASAVFGKPYVIHEVIAALCGE